MMPSAHAYVYVIGSVSGSQKIGVAGDCQRRLKMLQIGSPEVLELHHSEKFERAIAFKAEREVHKDLATRRVHGDWFGVSPAEAVKAIQAVALRFSSPMKGETPSADTNWQIRAKRTGVSQKDLGLLLGVHQNTVSMQVRGQWQSGVPLYVKTLIRALEKLSSEQIADLLDLTLKETSA